MESTSPGGNGQPQPASELFALVYDQLRDLARHRMSHEGKGHTLQATALVHEAYLRLMSSDGGGQKFANSRDFYFAAAAAMQRILIDHARAKKTVRRGKDHIRLGFSTVLDLAAAPEPEEILALDDAISRLMEVTPDAARVVQLRFYAGLNVEETAAAMGISVRTVNREWSYARAWLFRELESMLKEDDAVPG